MKSLAFSRLLLSLALAGCGASPERRPATPLPPAPPAPAGSPAPPSELADAEPPAKNEPPAPKPLRIEKAGPDTLRIEGDGTQVILRAKPVQGSKGWGLKITAEATSVDGFEHQFALIDRHKVPFIFNGFLHHGGPDMTTNFYESGIQGAPPKERTVGPSSAVTFERDYPGDPTGLWVTRGKSLKLWVVFGTVSPAAQRRSGRAWGSVGTIEMWVPTSGAPSLLLTPVESDPDGRPGDAG